MQLSIYSCSTNIESKLGKLAQKNAAVLQTEIDWYKCAYLISDVYSPVKVACPLLFSQIAKAKVAFCVLYPDISTSGDDKT